MALTIKKVFKNRLADRLGWKAGDQVLAIDSHPLADELDLRFHLQTGALQPSIHWEDSSGKSMRSLLPLEENPELGVEFEDFRVKVCRNQCIFCFVRQLPRGVRPGLLVRDDDFRLSFLHGNYLSLTNLKEAEIQRIIRQRISPLYVSVHSTERKIRARLLGRSPQECGLEILWRLVRAGIHIHAQIVLCPGINDGGHLLKTVRQLAKHYPGISSVAVVPVGLTRYRSRLPELIPVDTPKAQEILAMTHALQEELQAEHSTRFVFLADEFYLLAQQPIPGTRHYEGFHQLEDGIGMIASFRHDLQKELARLSRKPGRWQTQGTLVTGKLFAPYLRRFARRLEKTLGGLLSVVEVENRFLGPGVTVAGLLSGSDILEALQGRELGDWVIVPGESLAQHRQVFLDDMTLQQLEGHLGVPCRDAKRSAAGFLQTLMELRQKTDPGRRTRS